MNTKKRLYIETYGCQMNFSDSEIVASIMSDNGFEITKDIFFADIIFINTCSVRDKAEQRVKNRLQEFKFLKKKKKNLIIGVIGCMAEKLNTKFFEYDYINLVVGPDSYRDLPNLIKKAENRQKVINITLSKDETYSDIIPFRFNTNKVSAFISIMRGCENFCTYCVVPYTRGRERSRDAESIVNEAKNLFDKGYKEITLLGQNVNSYRWILKKKDVNFAKLIEMVALISPSLRVRFTTSNPKDISDELLYNIAIYDNICKSIHLPVQSGSNNVLKKMHRGYTREWYIERIAAINRIIPDCTISTDIITGFCGETEEDHKKTLALMNKVGYFYAYMFKYSERQGTIAYKLFKNDVPEQVKKRRLQEIINLQQKLSFNSNLKDINKIYKVLVDSISKRSDKYLSGRNSQNKVIVFPKKNYKIGDYVDVKVAKCTSATLIGEIV